MLDTVAHLCSNELMNTTQAKFPYRLLKPEAISGTVITFKCEMGHTFKDDMHYPKGKRHPARMNEQTVLRMFGYWSRNGTLKGICPKCEKTPS